MKTTLPSSLLRIAFTKQRNSATTLLKNGVLTEKSTEQKPFNKLILEEVRKITQRNKGATNAKKQRNNHPIFLAEKVTKCNSHFFSKNNRKKDRFDRVICLLEKSLDNRRTIYVDTENGTDDVIVLVLIHNVAAFELLVPKASYDPIKLIELIRCIEL